MSAIGKVRVVPEQVDSIMQFGGDVSLSTDFMIYILIIILMIVSALIFWRRIINNQKIS